MLYNHTRVLKEMSTELLLPRRAVLLLVVQMVSGIPAPASAPVPAPRTISASFNISTELGQSFSSDVAQTAPVPLPPPTPTPASGLTALVRVAPLPGLRSRAFLPAMFGTTNGDAGRRKKDGWPVLAAGLLMGATLLAVGLGTLAAMSGKALMSAVLALAMSLISAFRAPRCRRSEGGCSGAGDGSEDSRYEIIARPVMTHALVHHDPGPPLPGQAAYLRSLMQMSEPEPDVLLPEHEQSSVSHELAHFARDGVGNSSTSELLNHAASHSSHTAGDFNWLRGSPIVADFQIPVSHRTIQAAKTQPRLRSN